MFISYANDKYTKTYFASIAWKFNRFYRICVEFVLFIASWKLVVDTKTNWILSNWKGEKDDKHFDSISLSNGLQSVSQSFLFVFI